MSNPSRAVVGLLAVLFLVGCSSGSSDTHANYVAIDADAADQGEPAVVTASGDESAATEPAEGEPVSEFDRVTQTFDSFLALRARAIVGDLPLEELEDVATPAAIEQVLELRTENERRLAEDSYAALSRLAEWSNISAINEIDDTLLFTDCTERQYVTPGGFTVVRFVTNNVAVVADGDAYKVDRVDVVQDGVVALAPTEFGCAPPSFRDRAEATARLAVEAANRLIEDPAGAASLELPPVFAGPARDDLQRALDALAQQGLSRTADELVEFTVLGIDVNKPEFTVVVSVCRTYPTGRSYVDGAGNSTVSDLPVGSSHEEWVFISLEPVAADADPNDVAVAVEDQGPNCRATSS